MVLRAPPPLPQTPPPTRTFTPRGTCICATTIRANERELWTLHQSKFRFRSELHFALVDSREVQQRGGSAGLGYQRIALGVSPEPRGVADLRLVG